MGLRPEALPRNTSDMRDTIQAAPIGQATNAPIQYHIDSHLLPPSPMMGAPLDLSYHAPDQLDNMHQVLYDAGALWFQGNCIR
jgi:hypothetical protein